MSGVYRALLRCCVTVTALAALAFSQAAQAATPDVAWELHSVAQPTVFASTNSVEEELVSIRVAATGGTFTLTVEGETTESIPYDASDAAVGAAVNALPSLTAKGVHVTVTGGPGDEHGDSPYLVAVGGASAGDNLEQFSGSGVALTGPESTLETRTLREGRFVERYVITVTNIGGLASHGPVKLVDKLPAGVTTTRTPHSGEGAWQCTEGAGNSEVTCETSEPTGEGGESLASMNPAQPISIYVKTVPGVQGTLTNEVSISGGVPECGEENRPSCPEDHIQVSNSARGPAPAFEPLDFAASALDVEGSVDTEAAGHPAGLSTSLVFPSVNVQLTESIDSYPVEDPKQVVADLPAGFVGNAQAAPQCTEWELTLNSGHCEPATQIGTMTLISHPNLGRPGQNMKIFNLVPEEGYPAEFGFYEPGTFQRAVILYATVVPDANAPGGYVLQAISQNLPRALPIEGVSLTFFGDPAVQDASGSAPTALFTDPSDCQEPSFTTTLHVDSWQHPGANEADGQPDFSDPNWKEATSTSPAVTGCSSLQFHPSMQVHPTSSSPDAPAGLNVELNVPQSESPNASATPPLRNTTLTLPEGLVISPSAANGLQSCSDEQIGLGSTEPATCPPASQIGTVTIETPLLAKPLEGQMFLGTPECSPCTTAKGDPQSGRLVRLFIQVHSVQYGITVKIPGSVAVNPSNGQLTATFANNPQFPFSSLRLHTTEGPRGSLATPAQCGSYSATAALEPWSAPETPTANLDTPAFAISGCRGEGFAPSFVAGTTSSSAGGYAPFTLTLARNDGEQELLGLEATLPEGLAAKLAGVPLCGEGEIRQAEADAGGCPASSRIGSVTVAAGPGSDPYYTTGSIYLTGAYNGGPYGEVVEVPAVAGPFNLGTVVVRGSIRINRSTAQATVVSDPFPTALDGIPLQVRTVNTTLERPSFTLNATNCEALSVGARVISTHGAQTGTSAPYQATNCAKLPFDPVLTVSTQGKASKRDGASLKVKLTSKGGPEAGAEEANIKAVKVDLPKQLPSRLETLQRACLMATFEANPGSCPSESDIGQATVHTPLLNSPLSGPAYLVSRGAQFPDLEVVLQGDGITIVLDGKTDIKKGITSSDFETTPDVPFSTFELTFPEGRFSILGTDLAEKLHYNLCGQSLPMPTKITGQNGAVTKPATKIAVTGCVTHKKKSSKKNTKKSKKKKKKK